MTLGSITTNKASGVDGIPAELFQILKEESLDESKRGEWKADLKLNIQKTTIMASSPTTAWQIDGETMKTVTDFIFLGSKVTADGDCSHEIKDDCSLEEKLWPT